MSLPTIFQGDVQVNGTISASAMDLPPTCVRSSNFSAASTDRLEAAKAVHQFPVTRSQKNGTDAVTETVTLHIAKGAGTLVSFQIVADAVPAGGDKTVTIDFQKRNSGAWTSLLNAALVLDSSKSANTVYTAVLVATPTYAAGDLLRIVITAAGSTGTQAQGVCATAFVQEHPS